MKIYMKIVIGYSFSKLVASGGKSAQKLRPGSHEIKKKYTTID